jgi:hypothetical protein
MWALEMRVDKRPSSVAEFFAALNGTGSTFPTGASSPHIVAGPTPRGASASVVVHNSDPYEYEVALSIFKKDQFGHWLFHKSEHMPKGQDRVEVHLEYGDYWLRAVLTWEAPPEVARRGKNVKGLNDLMFSVTHGKNTEIEINGWRLAVRELN